ncbi:MAG: DUF1549 and DUF1553 domain-containing protein [Pirellulales bacterium]
MPTASSRAASRALLFAALGLLLTSILHPVAAEEPYGRFQFDETDLQHWSFMPVERARPPAVADAAWVKNPIDAFVLAGLEEAGLTPAPAADRRTLLRRLYLDLLGLPPTPEEQEAFLSDTSPGAVARLVDDLLSRPAYGERWGRHWLDVVRYAESNGYERDGAKPSVWRYRDYVIDSFNRDKPYDVFLREQLAGDELEGSNAEMQIATTFLRLGPWDDEPADPEVDRYDQLDDLVGATTATFMAQTVRCARCHDHKFESFTQRDYSRLLAVFEPLERPRDDRTDLDRPVGTASEVAAYNEALAKAKDAVVQVRRKFDEAEWRVVRRLAEAGVLTAAAASTDQAAVAGDGAPANPAAAEAAEAAGPPALSLTLVADALAAFQVEPAQRNGDQEKMVKKHRKELRSLLDKGATPEESDLLAGLLRDIEQAEAAMPPEPTKAYIWYEKSPQAPPTYVLARGDPRQRLEQVEPGVPAILVDGPLAPATPTAHSTGRRRQLAEWLTRPDNPLTARVMVNRIWQQHFGDGLAGTENDFGVMGEAPTHPGLLDWLAAEFVCSGWSIKHVHRLMLLSNTYQMSAEPNAAAEAKDRHNARLWRWTPRRLEAEAIRDSILAVSGRLNGQMGGPSVFPPIAPEVLASQSRPGSGWEKSEPEQAARRGIYMFVKRTLLIPELEVLDFPDTNNTCEQRAVSTVATQALTFLNGQFIHEQSRHFAERLMREAPDAAARVERAYALALARPPRDDERQAVLAFLAGQEQRIRDEAQSAGGSADQAAQQALQQLCLVLLNTNEFVYMR